MKELIRLIKDNPESQDEIIIHDVINSDWFEEDYKNSAISGVQASIIEELIQDINHADKLLKIALKEPISKELTKEILSWIAR